MVAITIKRTNKTLHLRIDFAEWVGMYLAFVIRMLSETRKRYAERSPGTFEWNIRSGLAIVLDQE